MKLNFDRKKTPHTTLKLGQLYKITDPLCRDGSGGASCYRLIVSVIQGNKWLAVCPATGLGKMEFDAHDIAPTYYEAINSALQIEDLS